MFSKWILIFLFSITAVYSYAQEKTSKNISVKKNAISYNTYGMSGFAGVTYERFISSRISAEVGAGLVGVGLGIKYFYTTVTIKKILLNTGITVTASPLFNTTDIRIVEGNGLLIYLPVGLSYFGGKGLNLGVDIGPGTTFTKTYNGNYLIVYGNFKVGFRFH